jgi:DnaJ-class molecular chaperone
VGKLRLRPCPHCGGRAETIAQRAGEDLMETWGQCTVCKARGEEVEDAYSDHDTAAWIWNKGTITPPVPALAQGGRGDG